MKVKYTAEIPMGNRIKIVTETKEFPSNISLLEAKNIIAVQIYSKWRSVPSYRINIKWEVEE